MPQRQPGPHRPFLVALLVAGAFSMENLDGTVIATALPQMAHSFGVPVVDCSVGMTAYLLALAVFIPISGWVADRFGARTVFGSAIAVFTLSSVFCGFSHGLAEFTVARVIQGMGGAMMVPVGRLTVLRTTEKKDLIKAIATLTWPGLAAPIVGPPLGGFITYYASWRWIFFLNVPFGIAGIVLTAFIVPNRREAQTRRFDWVGFVLTGSACCAIMYALDLLGRQNIRGRMAAAALAAGAALAIAAVRHAATRTHSLLDLDTLRIRTFVTNIRGGSLFRLSIGAVPFLLPLMFQVGFHMDPFSSGLLVLAVFAGNLAMKPATTPLLRLFGFRSTLIINGILAAASIWACGVLSPGTPKYLIIALLFLGGLFRSMQFTALSSVAFADVPPEQMSGANTLASVAQQVAFGMGVAFGAVALRFASALDPSGDGSLTVFDFRIAFALVGLAAFAGLYDCWRLSPGDGSEVSGHVPGSRAP